MSIHYSKYNLNTYANTPYFWDQLPDGYLLFDVLMKCRAFRRLPPNLKKLAGLSKQWFLRKNPGGVYGIGEYYDEAGYELNPFTGKRLTDAEIDAEWDDMNLDPDLAKVSVEDIPDSDFDDPDEWEVEWRRGDYEDRPSKEQVIHDIKCRGWKATARTYGLPEDSKDEYVTS